MGRENKLGAEMPSIESEEAEQIEQEKPAVFVKKPSLVIATRDGFFANERRKEGDKFQIEHDGQLGDWMKKI